MRVSAVSIPDRNNDTVSIAGRVNNNGRLASVGGGSVPFGCEQERHIGTVCLVGQVQRQSRTAD